MSDTPETDAWMLGTEDFVNTCIPLARKLERERDAALAKLSGKIEMGTVCVASKAFIDEIECERDSSEARAQELEVNLMLLRHAGMAAAEVDLQDRQRLTKERDEAVKQAAMWKANHDNQVYLRKLMMDRPDLGDRAERISLLIGERDAARLELEMAAKRGIEWRSIDDLPPEGDVDDEFETRCVVVWQDAEFEADQGAELSNLAHIRDGDFPQVRYVNATWKTIMDAPAMAQTSNEEE